MEGVFSATPQPLYKQKSKRKKSISDPYAQATKPLFLSPYFGHNGQQSPTPVKPLVLSPYFLKSPQLQTVENAHVHVLPPGYFHQNNRIKLHLRKNSHTTFQHSHIQIPNTSEREKRGKGNREKKKEALVVSPYFHNINKDVGEASTSPSTSAREREDLKRSSSNFNKFLGAYRRKSVYNTWIPPNSVYGLLQEKYYDDPWKVLVICMLLNRTTGRQAANVIANLFELCPNAKAATEAETEKIENIITTLGLQRKRSMMIQQFSQDYLSDEWTHVTQLHGIGKYAADAYAIFCTGHWKDINPDDHKLVPYWEDLWFSEKIRLSVT